MEMLLTTIIIPHRRPGGRLITVGSRLGQGTVSDGGAIAAVAGTLQLRRGSCAPGVESFVLSLRDT
ncbi:hypothetical protein GCM10022630_00670 [Thermobifida alba]